MNQNGSDIWPDPPEQGWSSQLEADTRKKEATKNQFESPPVTTESPRKPALERLEEWQAGSKSRSVDISHDDGYGASCWEVMLSVRGRRITALAKSTPAVMSGHVAVWDHKNDDWPSLEMTIHAAIDEAEKEGL